MPKPPQHANQSPTLPEHREGTSQVLPQTIQVQANPSTAAAKDTRSAPSPNEECNTAPPPATNDGDSDRTPIASAISSKAKNPGTPAVAANPHTSRASPATPRIPLRRKFAVAGRSNLFLSCKLLLTPFTIDLEDEAEVRAAGERSRKHPRPSTSAPCSSSSAVGRGNENNPPTRQLRPQKKVRRLGGKT